MLRFFQTVSMRQLRYGLILLAFCVSFGLTANQRMAVPAHDALQYLAYAKTLYEQGTYAASAAGPQADASPGREVLYPAVIASLAVLSPDLRHAVQSCNPPQDSCAGGYRVLAYVNAVCLALTITFAILTVEALGARRAAVLVCGLYLLLNLHMTKNLKETLSDFLAMALVAALSWQLVLALRLGGLWRWACVGILLAGLNLTKAIFLPFTLGLGLVVVIAGVLHLIRGHGRSLLLGGMVFCTVILAINGGWMLRNISHFGRPSDSERGGVGLSTREVFNHMTPQDHLAAFVWWTGGAGDGWAKAIFPENVWKKFEWYEEQGYYLQGQVYRVENRIAQSLQQNPHWSRNDAERHLARQVAGEIAQNFGSYLLTMPVMIYRGLWIDEAPFISFPALILVSWWAWRARRWDIMAVLALGWWSILAYAMLTLNLHRYQMTAMVALPVAVALAWDHKTLFRKH